MAILKRPVEGGLELRKDSIGRTFTLARLLFRIRVMALAKLAERERFQDTVRPSDISTSARRPALPPRLSRRYPAECLAADAIYEFKIDTDGDAVAEIAYRVRFSPFATGAQP
jgi:hypothetical protein